MSGVMESGGEGGAGRGTRTILWIVFTTILIDFIGFGVLIPVLPLFADRLGATPVQVGLILTVYALAQLLFLPVWGWFSDRIGRRPIILVSLFGTAVSFAVLAASESLGMIYLSRALAGFFAASIGTAQAVVTDVTEPRDRARGMGLIGASFGLGMVIGPTLGGLLAPYGERLPFYAITVLASVNLVAAWFRLPESRPPELRRPDYGSLRKSFIPTPIRLMSAVHERRIALFLYLFFHMFTAFAALEAMFTLYLGERYGLGARQAGLIFGWIAIFIALTQGFLVGRLALRFSEVHLVVAGLIATGCGLAAIGMVPSYPWLFLVGPIIAIGNGIAFPSFSSLYSKACEAEQVGELLGQSQSMATSGRVVGPIWAGLAMGGIQLEAPFVIGGVLMLISCLIFILTRRILVGELT
ncbi:MAG: MFS transporter [Deltaproteobacteria bacterium]|nr:MAG: MFS transporter [Deltaproteobacteria bacterium]